MEKIDWKPFIKAAIERNPVCFNDLSGKDTSQIYEILKELPDESIYDTGRLALPDEVWNFKRGDGVEKAILLADTILKSDRSVSIMIKINNDSVMLEAGGEKYHFTSGKRFSKTITLENGEIYVL
jgi:hypothetical protein